VVSSRIPANLSANRLTAAIAQCRARRRPFIDLTLSNPTGAGFDYPSDLLGGLADPRALRYEPTAFGLADARAAVARDYQRQGLSVPPERVVLTASTSDAYSMLFKLLADADDEILVPRPSYPLFDHLTRLDLVRTRFYDLDLHAGWQIDFASIERALTPRTRAILVVSPNNPTGSFLSAAELDRLSGMCAPRGIALIADEVFADYELEPGAAGRSARPFNCRGLLTFSLGGLSKSVGLPQVKLGWIAVGGPESVVAAALGGLELVCDTYLAVSTPVQIAAADLLTRGAVVRNQIAARVGSNYRQLMTMSAGTPSCGVMRSHGGWYAVMHVPSFEPEEDLVLRLLTSDGVLAHPGYFFDFPCESFLVVSLLSAETSFHDGVVRVLRHFACSPMSA
jgi:alanine-synthesizing transaminase